MMISGLQKRELSTLRWTLPLELVRVEGLEGGFDEGAEAPLGGLPMQRNVHSKECVGCCPEQS